MTPEEREAMREAFREWIEGIERRNRTKLDALRAERAPVKRSSDPAVRAEVDALLADMRQQWRDWGMR